MIKPSIAPSLAGLPPRPWTPEGQKYPTGTRVRIADDLGPSRRYFPCGTTATVISSYAQEYGGEDVKEYDLDVDGFGPTAWYPEDKLSPIGKDTR